MPASQVGAVAKVLVLSFVAESILLQNPQQRAVPQGLSEDALKEALQVPCIWVESQDLQNIRCQEVEREVSTFRYMVGGYFSYTTSGCLLLFRWRSCHPSYRGKCCAQGTVLHRLTLWCCLNRCVCAHTLDVQLPNHTLSRVCRCDP